MQSNSSPARSQIYGTESLALTRNRSNSFDKALSALSGVVGKAEGVWKEKKLGHPVKPSRGWAWTP